MKKFMLLSILMIVLSVNADDRKSALSESVKGIPVLPLVMESMPVIVNYFSKITGMKFLMFSTPVLCDNTEPLMLAGKKQNEQIKEFISACNKDKDECLACSYMIRDNILILFSSSTAKSSINMVLDSKFELKEIGGIGKIPLFRKKDGDLYSINQSAKAVIVDNLKMKGNTFLEVIEDYYHRHPEVQGVLLGVNNFHVYDKPVLSECRDMLSKLSDVSSINTCRKEDKDNLFFSFCYYMDFEKDKLIEVLSEMDWMKSLRYRPGKNINELRYLLFKRFLAVKNNDDINDFLVNSFLKSRDLSFKYHILSRGLLPKVDGDLYRSTDIRQYCLTSGDDKLESYFQKKQVKLRTPVIYKKGASLIKFSKFVQPEVEKLFKGTQKSTYYKESLNKEVTVELEYECYKYKKPFIVYKLSQDEIDYTKSPEQAGLSNFTENILIHKRVQKTIVDLQVTELPLMVFEYRINFTSNGRRAVILWGYGYKKKNNQFVKSERSSDLLWNGQKWVEITELGYDDPKILNFTLIESQLSNRGYSFFKNKNLGASSLSTLRNSQKKMQGHVNSQL